MSNGAPRVPRPRMTVGAEGRGLAGASCRTVRKSLLKALRRAQSVYVQGSRGQDGPHTSRLPQGGAGPARSRQRETLKDRPLAQLMGPLFSEKQPSWRKPTEKKGQDLGQRLDKPHCASFPRNSDPPKTQNSQSTSPRILWWPELQALHAGRVDEETMGPQLAI